ncbi:GNAT family N-acetyltransferase [Acidobacteria bacterium AH-259-D05]|nr:GNAT family N-acetyltransferase [Acidobacteria bacterium AH-259-D05]
MEGELQISRYQDSDHEEVVALHYLGLDQVGANLGGGPWDKDLNDIQNHYINNNGDFLVGICGGRLVAMGAFRKVSTTRAEIKRIRVNPDFQRRGFGEEVYAEERLR